MAAENNARVQRYAVALCLIVSLFFFWGMANIYIAMLVPALYFILVGLFALFARRRESAMVQA